VVLATLRKVSSMGARLLDPALEDLSHQGAIVLRIDGHGFEGFGEVDNLS